MQKRIYAAVIAIALVTALGIVGCVQVDTVVKPFVSKVYIVVVKADEVLGQVEAVIAGSELAVEIADEIAQVRLSLQTIKTSLETLANFLNIELTAEVSATLEDALKELENATKCLDEENAKLVVALNK